MAVLDVLLVAGLCLLVVLLVGSLLLLSDREKQLKAAQLSVRIHEQQLREAREHSAYLEDCLAKAKEAQTAGCDARVGELQQNLEDTRKLWDEAKRAGQRSREFLQHARDRMQRTAQDLHSVITTAATDLRTMFDEQLRK